MIEMNRYLTIWRYTIIFLLNVSIHRSLLLLTGGLSLVRQCDLTVDPAPPFLLGSDLMVYCHIRDSQWRLKWREISLDLNRNPVRLWKEFNDTTMIFKLTKVQNPNLTLYCKLKHKWGSSSSIVGALSLHGGYPPDKPGKITCETTNTSEFTECSWVGGRVTHLHTTYGVSLCRENGTLVKNWTREAENISIRREMLLDNTKYHLIISAHNQLGASLSDPFPLCLKDYIVPEIPFIRQIRFENSSLAAVLQWSTTDSLKSVTSHVMIRKEDGPWEAREATQLGKDLIRVDGLQPMTLYEFQMKICNSTPELPHAGEPSLTSTERSRCSKWSSPVERRSPPKGPSQLTHVWRMSRNRVSNTTQEVLVLWKPLPPDDYSGEVKEYKILLGDEQRREVTCPADSTQCSVRVPAEVKALGVSVVTMYGTSAPAQVPLQLSGVAGPALRKLSPAPNGTAVLVLWARMGTDHLSHYVVEWTSVPAGGLQWKHLSREQDSTVITGLAAGVRYNVSLYAVTSRGVSAPSSRLTYSEELKPAAGPSVLVVVRESHMILIQWGELPVQQQRGFITNYTIYLQTLNSMNSEQRVMVPASGPRETWLKCPEGAVALQMSATNSAGEGPTGGLFSQPAAPGVGLVIVIVFVVVLFIGVVANLMSWTCVRKRIKQRCISWSPDWLVGDVPKLGNSVAIRLLKQDGSEPLFSLSTDDPPLSPISCVSHDEVYPNMHTEVVPAGSRAADPGLAEDGISYKPQATVPDPLAEEALEEYEEYEQQSGEEDLQEFGGILGDLLPNVEVDFSDLPLAQTLSSACGFLWPKTPEPALTGDLLSRTQAGGETDPPSVGSKQETDTPEQGDVSSSLCTVEAVLSNGYFPQISAVR